MKWKFEQETLSVMFHICKNVCKYFKYESAWIFVKCNTELLEKEGGEEEPQWKTGQSEQGDPWRQSYRFFGIYNSNIANLFGG